MSEQGDGPKRTSELPSKTVRVLGSFQLEIDGEAVQLPLSSQLLVAYLGLDPYRRKSRGRVAEAVWPERRPGVALTRLREAIHYIRKCDVGILDTSGGSLALVQAVSVDRQALEERLREVAAMNPPDDGAVKDLGDLLVTHSLARDLLADWSDPAWVAESQRDWDRFRLRMMEQISASLSRLGMPQLANELADLGLKVDPLRESLHESIVRTHIMTGNYAEARRHLSYCERLLADEMGACLSPHLQELRESLP